MKYEEKIKRKQLSKRIKRRRALDYFFLIILIFLVALLIMVLLPVVIRTISFSPFPKFGTLERVITINN